MIVKCNRTNHYCSHANRHNKEERIFEDCRFFEKDIELIDKHLGNIYQSFRRPNNRMSAEKFLEVLKGW